MVLPLIMSALGRRGGVTFIGIESSCIGSAESPNLVCLISLKPGRRVTGSCVVSVAIALSVGVFFGPNPIVSKNVRVPPS